MARRSPDSDRTALLGSAAIHVVAVLLAFLSTAFEREPLEFISYEIEIVSPPSSVQADVAEPAPPEEQLQVETPDPTPPEEVQPEPVVEEKPTPPPERKPEPTKPETRPVEKPAEEKPAETKPATPDPEPTELSGADMEVRMEGLRKDYPAYYNNIIGQIQRCFRPPPGVNAETTVDFFIRRDGTVVDPRITKRSGNIDFDLESVAAVECAGGPGRLGPLPEDLPYDRLPVRFNFRPRGQTPDPS